MDVEIELAVRGRRLIVKTEDQRETVSETGLIVVKHHAPSVIGTAVAVGDRVADVKEGDVVLFTPESGQQMRVGQDSFLVLNEDEVLAVWDEEKEPI